MFVKVFTHNPMLDLTVYDLIKQLQKLPQSRLETVNESANTVRHIPYSKLYRYKRRGNVLTQTGSFNLSFRDPTTNKHGYFRFARFSNMVSYGQWFLM